MKLARESVFRLILLLEHKPDRATVDTVYAGQSSVNSYSLFFITTAYTMHFSYMYSILLQSIVLLLACNHSSAALLLLLACFHGSAASMLQFCCRLACFSSAAGLHASVLVPACMLQSSCLHACFNSAACMLRHGSAASMLPYIVLLLACFYGLLLAC